MLRIHATAEPFRFTRVLREDAVLWVPGGRRHFGIKGNPMARSTTSQLKKRAARGARRVQAKAKSTAAAAGKRVAASARTAKSRTIRAAKPKVRAAKTAAARVKAQA